jgi:hypothetical protein
MGHDHLKRWAALFRMDVNRDTTTVVLDFEAFIFENRGSSPYNMTDEDATITLFKNNTWQAMKILNSTISIARLDSDEDGNSLAILTLPSQVQPKSQMEFSVSYEMRVSSRLRPSIEVGKSGILADIPKEVPAFRHQR